MIFILDQYSSLFAAYIGQSVSDNFSPDEVINWLELIELQCPGRGV